MKFIRTSASTFIQVSQVTRVDAQVSESADQTWQIVVSLSDGTTFVPVAGHGLDALKDAYATVLNWLEGE